MPSTVYQQDDKRVLERSPTDTMLIISTHRRGQHPEGQQAIVVEVVVAAASVEAAEALVVKPLEVELVATKVITLPTNLKHHYLEANQHSINGRHR